MRQTDTIVAPITATGGAVAGIRVSGTEAFGIARRVLDSWPSIPGNRQALHGSFCTGDDGLALPFHFGHGYTGEEAVEFFVHGSRAAVGALTDACLSAGARLAEPGEFSLRAFMNGRIDLAQAEAVRDTVAAQTIMQLRFANAQRSGALTRRIGVIREEALRVLAEVEASVDFSEEIGEFDSIAGQSTLSQIMLEIQGLLDTQEAGRIARRGLRIAIIGPPNAGKSSLLNRLLGSDRAIVTPIAGTTRDTIEESVSLAGISCVLIDTAGLRDTVDQLELLGVQRTYDAASSADLVWYVHDSTEDLPEDLPYHDLLISNKSDLASGQHGLNLSAVTGDGVEALGDWLSDRFKLETFDVVIDPRHAPHLAAAKGAVEQALATVVNDLPADLLSVHLRTIVNELGMITGETATADMVERIFSDFCIGK